MQQSNVIAQNIDIFEKVSKYLWLVCLLMKQSARNKTEEEINEMRTRQ